MLGLMEWLVTVIILVLVVGVLYWVLQRALALVEAPPKVAEAVLLGVLLVIILFAVGFVLSGSLQPVIRFR